MFSTTRLRPGYSQEQVDAFVDAIRDTFLGVKAPPLTSDEVRNKQFTTTRLREGYDEEEVDAFLEEVEARLPMGCPRCGAARAEATQVCAQCGTPVSEQWPAAANPDADPSRSKPIPAGDIQDAAATAAETAGLAPGGAHTSPRPGDAGSGPQLTAGDIGAPPWAAGTPLPSEMTGGFPLPADITGAEPPPRHRRTAILTAVAVTLVAAVAATAIVLGKASVHKPTAAQAPTPTAAPTAQELTIDGLSAGTCIQGPPDFNTANTVPELVTAVPCTRQHFAEVYFFSDVYWSVFMAFPGNAAISRRSDAQCRKAFRSYDGIPPDASQYSYWYISPWGRQDWNSGDRLLACVADLTTSGVSGGLPLHTSIKGSDS
jgi:DivIVA domain-containing protein